MGVWDSQGKEGKRWTGGEGKGREGRGKEGKREESID